MADLLRAMGYRTTVSSQGGDSGIDETCGSGGFVARAKINSEVIWSEQGSI